MTTLEFSDPRSHVASAWPRWSPSGHAVAVVTARGQVAVWAGDMSAKIKEAKPLADEIQHLEWSPDGELLLCGHYKSSAVTVLYASGDRDVLARIEDPALGYDARPGTQRPVVGLHTHGTPLHTEPSDAAKPPPSIVKAWWTPDSRHLLTFSDMDVRTTVWSLATGDQHILEDTGRRRERGISFRSDETYAAVAERRECTDSIVFVDCRAWTVLRRIPVKTRDLESVDWTPNNRAIVLADTALDYRILVYSPTGECLQSYSAYDDQLGVRTLRISALGMIAAGSYDEKVRVLDPLTWKLCCELAHASTLTVKDSAVHIFVEAEVPSTATAFRSQTFGSLMSKPPVMTKYDEVGVPYTVRTDVAEAGDKGAAPVGVNMLEFSPGGRYLASRNENMPTAVWIWDLAQLRQVALLVQRQPVRGFRWMPAASASNPGAGTTAQGVASSPTRPALGAAAAFARAPEIDADARLAIWSDTNSLYLWQPQGAFVVPLPFETPLNVAALQWHPHGQTLVVADKVNVAVGSVVSA